MLRRRKSCYSRRKSTATSSNRKPRTRVPKLSILPWHLKRFTETVGNLPLDKITPQHIRDFILYQQDRGLAPHSVHPDYKMVSAFFRWCLSDEMPLDNPLDSIKAPRLPQLLPKGPTPEQVEVFLASLKKDTSLLGRRNYMIAMVLLDCGLRANETVNVTLKDVHRESSCVLIRHRKGGMQRPDTYHARRREAVNCADGRCPGFTS